MSFVLSIHEKGKRETNEDSCYSHVDGHIGVYLVADGCGGHASGQEASDYAVKYLADHLFHRAFEASEDSISIILRDCNKMILQNQKDHGSMRTTIVGLIRKDSDTYAFNVGDCRLYQIRAGKVIFQTEDHSVPYVLYKAGIISEDEINTHEDRNKLLQALGAKEDLKSRIYRLDPQGEDLFLLASDGFWEYLRKPDFAECTPDKAGRWLKSIETRIINADDPEQDNYTALLIGDING